jgi:transposase
VARRYEALCEEISELEANLDRLVAQAAPELVSLPGIGTDNAATLLVVALRTTLRGWAARPPSPGPVWGRPHRSLLRQGGEASPQGSGGNREANRALYMICLARMRRDRRRQQYVARRTQEGKSKREIIRCLKRYVARELYRVLISCGARPSQTGRKDEVNIVAGSSAA